jgi:GNAT superfamily N-acetyltransferase
MDSWLNCLRGEYPQLPDDIFFTAYRAVIERLFKTSQVRVLADGDRIAGYSVTWDADGVLHWIYLKNQYRGKGLAKLLLSHLPPYPKSTFRCRSRRLNLGQLREPLLRRLKK